MKIFDKYERFAYRLYASWRKYTRAVLHTLLFSPFLIIKEFMLEVIGGEGIIYWHWFKMGHLGILRDSNVNTKTEYRWSLEPISILDDEYDSC